MKRTNSRKKHLRVPARPLETPGVSFVAPNKNHHPHEMTTLRAFLGSRRVTKDREWNITGMSKEDKGKYYVSNTDYDAFITLFYQNTFIEKRHSSLLERHSDYTPLLIDLDFKHTEKHRIFSVDNIRNFISMYAKAFFHFIDHTPIRFFVQVKATTSEEKGIGKDGIHIVCPDISVPYNIPFTLRYYLLEQNIIGTCFPGLINPAKDVFDESVIQRNNWFLYGATKPDKDAYAVTQCYLASDAGVENVVCNETDAVLVNLFSLQRGHNTATNIIFRDDTKEEWTMWESTANTKKPMKTMKTKKPDKICDIVMKPVTDDVLSIVTNQSEEISKILNVNDTWGVCEMDEGYKLTHNSNRCLVVHDVVHSTSGHSCIFVQRTHANLFCFSHNAVALAKPIANALWRLLSYEEECDELIDDVYACRKFVHCMAGEIHREGEAVYIFSNDTGMWETSDTALMSAVHRHKTSLVFQTVKDNGSKTALNYGGSTKFIHNMLAHLKALLPNETFIADNIDASLAYLLFADGIFHIPTQTFSSGFDKTKVFMSRIARRFPLARDRVLEAEINTRLFVQPFSSEAVGSYMKMRFARSLAGCYCDKKFICALGDADSSKGTITKAMRSAFGGYVVEWNANYLKYNGHSGADEAKKLSWIFPFVHARLAISNEARMDKTPLDGNLIKTLSSGGDEMSARKNFRDEMPIIVRASFFYLGNDMPAITPKDSGIQTRVRMIRFSKRFVERPSGTNELLADPLIKSKIATTEWSDSLFWLIMDAYSFRMDEPDDVLEETKEWVPCETMELREVLEEKYTIDVADASDDNFTSSRDIIAYLKTMNVNLSDQKIGRELSKLGLIKDDKRIEGKTIRILRGIKD